MPKRLLAATALTGVILLLAILSCDVNAPERVVRAPVIKGFAPKAASFGGLVGDTLEFAITAIDPSDLALDFFFTLSDSIVSRSAGWKYVVHDTGMVEIRAYVTNGHVESFVAWELLRTQPANKPPVIVETVPPDLRPSVIVGNSIGFGIIATDPEGGVLSYAYTVDDSIVSLTNQFVFFPDQVGPVFVKAIVTDGAAFTFHTWNVQVNAQPDSVPPSTVILSSLATGVEPGELVVEWTAVGEDSMVGLPTYYDVRTSSIPIEDEHSWNTASRRTGAPVPAPVGTTMRMVVRDLKPANFVWLAIRAVDDFGNFSPLGNTLGDMTRGMDIYGTVGDAVTGDPLSGMRVRLLGVDHLTAADGSYAILELPEAFTPFRVSDELEPDVVGGYFDVLTARYEIQHRDIIDFWLIPNLELSTGAYPDFRSFVAAMASTQGLDNYMATYEFPVDVHVPFFVKNGLDYRNEIIDVMGEWERVTGLDFFRVVNAPPDVGVVFEYSGSINGEFYELLEWDEKILPIRGRVWIRTLYEPALRANLRKIVAHELGHVIGMGHSIADAHLMIGLRAPLPSLPTQDEIWLARVMYYVPRGTDLETIQLD
jgi:hypothetical protein